MTCLSLVHDMFIAGSWHVYRIPPRGEHRRPPFWLSALGCRRSVSCPVFGEFWAHLSCIAQTLSFKTQPRGGPRRRPKPSRIVFQTSPVVCQSSLLAPFGSLWPTFGLQVAPFWQSLGPFFSPRGFIFSLLCSRLHFWSLSCNFDKNLIKRNKFLKF